MADVGRRNPDWEWDEIVLACDLVAQNDWRQIDHSSPKVAELSELLQRMTLHPGEIRLPNFRSESSVARKTADIATWHPYYQGKRTNGNRLDREVMDQFIAQPDVMHALAESIRDTVARGEPADFPVEIGYEDESVVGGALPAPHTRVLRTRPESPQKEDQKRPGRGWFPCLRSV